MEPNIDNDIALIGFREAIRLAPENFTLMSFTLKDVSDSTYIYKAKYAGGRELSIIVDRSNGMNFQAREHLTKAEEKRRAKSELVAVQ